MKATVTKISSNQVKIDFEVEPEVFERGMQEAYRSNVKRINIQGFRRGKAPRKVIELQYGESIFYEDAIDAIFPEVYGEAVKENKLEPVDRPSFELGDIGTGKTLTFSVEVYVKPDVELGEYKGVEAHNHRTVVSDDDVKAAIEREREQAATFIDIEDRPVKLDDQVTLDFAGYIDGEAFEGGSAEDHNLAVGSGSFIPGFEEQLVGAEIGKEITVDVTFPEDYHAEELKGKPAQFKVTIKSIKEKDLPELDDEFAKDVSECETLDEYREKVRGDLQKQADERSDNEFENQAVAAAVDNASVDIPERMIEDRIDTLMRDMQMRLMYQGMNMETYTQYTGQTEEMMRGFMRENAERDVKTQLVIEAVASAEDIVASEADIDAEIEKYVERSRGDLEKFRENLTDEDKAYFENMFRMQRAVDIIKENAVEPEHPHGHDHDHDHDHHDHDHGDHDEESAEPESDE